MVRSNRYKSGSSKNGKLVVVDRVRDQGKAWYEIRAWGPG